MELDLGGGGGLETFDFRPIGPLTNPPNPLSSAPPVSCVESDPCGPDAGFARARIARTEGPEATATLIGSGQKSLILGGFSAKLGPETPLDRRGSSCSAGWTKNQAVKPIRMPFRDDFCNQGLGRNLNSSIFGV